MARDKTNISDLSFQQGGKLKASREECFIFAGTAEPEARNVTPSFVSNLLKRQKKTLGNRWSPHFFGVHLFSCFLVLFLADQNPSVRWFMWNPIPGASNMGMA